MIRIAIAGAGRMGTAIAAGIEQCADLENAGTWHRGSDLDALVAAADVLVDFSLPSATAQVLRAAVASGTPLVCGVSGLDTEQVAAMKRAAERIPVLYDRNMSLGIAVLERSVREAAATLGPGFRVEISEVHHVHKQDAPSGTALKLAAAVAAARGEEGTGNVTFQVERRGEVPGDHDVVMSSDTERLTFSHSVTTRQVFADGALRAARWIVDQSPGYYRMADVLFAH